MKMFSKFAVACTFVLILAFIALPVLAQSTLNLTLHRDFGFGNGSQIRGTFSMDVQSDSPLQSVTYKIDDQVIQEVTSAPFKIQFNTGTYAAGWHDLSATAVTTDGQTLQAAAKRFNFLSAEQESKAMGGILVPMLGGVAVILVVVIGINFLFLRRRSNKKIPLGEPRSYGMRGGAICPRCHRPFPIHMTAINLTFTGKLDTCDHCGRFGLVHPVSLQKLRAAEAAELKDGSVATVPFRELTPEEKLRQQLESSKYEDL